MLRKMSLLILGIHLFWAGPGYAQGAVRVDGLESDFSTWTLKTFKGRATYEIKKTPRPMITLSTEGSNYLLLRALPDFDLLKYPVLTFEWMVEKHPLHGDLRKRETDDQAAGLYVTLPSFPEAINFKAIGYVWENGAPPGVYPSLSSGNIKYVVLRSGPADLGQWHKERRNVVEDFKKLWGVTITGRRKVVIGLGADSDGTKSSSVGSFGPICFLRQ